MGGFNSGRHGGKRTTADMRALDVRKIQRDGLLTPGRPDQLGAFWYLCLLGFLIWGRSRMLYVGAFVVVSYLELVGTALGTWAWAAVDPVLGVVGQGNPPSGAAGGYGWFDLYAILLAPRVLVGWAALTVWSGGPRAPARSADGVGPGAGSVVGPVADQP